jgi:hypothetical protein
MATFESKEPRGRNLMIKLLSKYTLRKSVKLENDNATYHFLENIWHHLANTSKHKVIPNYLNDNKWSFIQAPYSPLSVGELKPNQVLLDLLPKLDLFDLSWKMKFYKQLNPHDFNRVLKNPGTTLKDFFDHMAFNIRNKKTP